MAGRAESIKQLTWLALNGLRWLTVVAVIAWANPQPIHAKAWPVPPPSPMMVRLVQLAPCAPWALRLGRWGAAYVCASYPDSKALYLQALKHRALVER
jgi:hypothetical protein